jgi:predicted nucleotidyltransferase
MNNINIFLDKLKTLSKQLPQEIPYLKMLILFGSQARGDTHSKSDWDFAALYDQEMREKHCENNAFAWFEVTGILGDIFELNSDQIDVIDLDNCSVNMADAIASHGQIIYEEKEGLFTEFKKKSLLTAQEKRVIHQNLYQEIDNFLQSWRIV